MNRKNKQNRMGFVWGALLVVRFFMPADAYASSHAELNLDSVIVEASSDSSSLDPLKALGISENDWLALNHGERASLLLETVEGGSRLDLYSALILIRRDIASFRKKAEAEPFLLIMPRLATLANERDLSSIGPNLLEETAESLTTHMLRPAWLNLESASAELVTLYHRWATNSAADAYVTDLIHLLGLNDPLRYNVHFSDAESKTFAKNVEYLIGWAVQERTPSLARSYQFLISVFAKFQLRNLQHLSLEDRLYWIRQLRDESTISNVLIFLKEEAANAVAGESSALNAIADSLIALKQHVEDLTLGATPAGDRTYIPEYLRLEGPSQLATDLLYQGLIKLHSYPEATYMGLLNCLRVSGMETYATRVREFLERGEGDKKFLDSFLKQVQALLLRMRRNSLDVAANELERKLGKAAAGVQAKLLDLEGSYLVQTSGGESFRLVLAFADKNRIVAGLGKAEFGTVVRFGFMNVSYEYEDNKFVATEEVQSTDDERNQWMQFAFVDGEIVGQFYVPLSGFQKFRGQRQVRFNDYFAEEYRNAESVYGRYQGEMTCTSGNPLFVELGVVKFPDKRMYGTLTLTSIIGGERRMVARMDFQDGLFDRQTGVVYLTGKSNNTTLRDWRHVRGVVRNGVFYGQYIVGASGVRCDNLELRKVEAADDF